LTSQSPAPLILVVDDYAEARELYAEFLESSGYRVAQAQDGAEAVAQTSQLRPNAVLMDLSLPGMDGWEAMRLIKRDPVTAGIPIIALTGFTSLNPRAAGSTCAAVLFKPCLPEDVISTVERVLRATPGGLASVRGSA
jgi:CheY-like chemotaxis protein